MDHSPAQAFRRVAVRRQVEEGHTLVVVGKQRSAVVAGSPHTDRQEGDGNVADCLRILEGVGSHVGAPGKRPSEVVHVHNRGRGGSLHVVGILQMEDGTGHDCADHGWAVAQNACRIGSHDVAGALHVDHGPDGSGHWDGGEAPCPVGRHSGRGGGRRESSAHSKGERGCNSRKPCR